MNALSGNDALVALAVADPNRPQEAVALSTDGLLHLFHAEPGQKPYLSQGTQPVGLSDVTALVGADVNADGRMDLLIRADQGHLYVSLASPDGASFASPSVIGDGWDRYDTLLPADLNADGRTDLLARDLDGGLFLYLAKPDTGYLEPADLISHGWGKYDMLVPADLNADGYTDLLAQQGDGTLNRYVTLPGKNYFGPAAAVPEGGFLYPGNGESVISPLVPNGTASLDSDHELWLLLKPVGGDTYYVTTDSEIAVNPSGHWDSHLDLGEGKCDQGKHYELYAVSAPGGGTIEQEIPRRPPGQYSVRLHTIPTDTLVLSKIEIILGEYRGTRTC